MNRTSARSSESLRKISAALESLKTELSHEEYRKFDLRAHSLKFQISTTFGTVLKNLKAIEVNPAQRGEFKLTGRITTLRPSTVLKGFNSYSAESRANRNVPKRVNKTRTKPVPAVTADVTIQSVIIALKDQIRKEVMSELLSSLTK